MSRWQIASLMSPAFNKVIAEYLGIATRCERGRMNSGSALSRFRCESACKAATKSAPATNASAGYYT